MNILYNVSIVNFWRLLTMKKALKVIAVLVGIAAIAVAAYILIKKYVDSKRVVIGNDAENYVSCSFCDDTFVSETVA